MQARDRPRRRASPPPMPTQFQINLQTKGRLITPEEFGNIIVARQPRRLGPARLRDVARVELGAATQDTREPAERQPGDHHRHLPRAGRQRGRDLGAGDRDARRRWRQRFPPGMKKIIFYDSSTFVTDTHPRGGADAGRGVRAGGAGGVPLPRQPARHHHSRGRGAGEPDRHLRRAARRGLFGQHRLAARAGAGRSAWWWTTRSWWWRTSSG